MSAVVERLPAAQPCEDHVFCVECGEPHRATFVDGKGFIEMDSADMPCELYERLVDEGTPAEGFSIVDQLPKDWERTHHATYHVTGRGKEQKTRYLMTPKLAPMIPWAHKVLYYLTEEDA